MAHAANMQYRVPEADCDTGAQHRMNMGTGFPEDKITRV